MFVAKIRHIHAGWRLCLRCLLRGYCLRARLALLVCVVLDVILWFFQGSFVEKKHAHSCGLSLMVAFLFMQHQIQDLVRVYSFVL